MKGKRVLKKQSNRNGLLSTYFASLFSVMLCFVMLLGTTFAWFYTDNTSLGNEIHSGILKVDMLHDGVSLAEQPDHAVFTSEVWSPKNYRQTEEIEIHNTGSVALDYKLDFVPVTGALSARGASELFAVSVDGTRLGTLDEFLSDMEDDTDDWLLAAGQQLEPGASVSVSIDLQMDVARASGYMGQSVPVYLKLEASQTLAASSEQIQTEE